MREFTFIDLFSGIGGFHCAAKALGGHCLLACDKDERARELYTNHFKIVPHDDIRTAPIIKNADLLCAGPPCQAFSTIGDRKGTKDPRGLLIYALARYILQARPKSFIIENVKGLTHTSTFNQFVSMLSKAYSVSHSIIDARHLVPQHRERVYLVGRLKTSTTIPFDFELLNPFLHQNPTFENIQDSALDRMLITHKFDNELSHKLLDKRTPVGFILRAQKNNFINNKLFSSWGIVGTLCATFTPILYDERHQVARRLSINEMRRCQGFPSDFIFPNRTAASFHLGNAVCIPVVHLIMEML